MRDVSLHDLSSDEIESVRQAIGREPDRRTKVTVVDDRKRVYPTASTISVAVLKPRRGLSDAHTNRPRHDVVSVAMRVFRGRDGFEWRVGTYEDGDGRTVVLLVR